MSAWISASPSAGSVADAVAGLAASPSRTRISEAGASSPTALPMRAALPGELVRTKATRLSRFGLRRRAAKRRAKPANAADAIGHRLVVDGLQRVPADCRRAAP